MLYIKNMKMPKCCADCFALDEYGDYPVCGITDEQMGYTFNIREKRMPHCPLIESRGCLMEKIYTGKTKDERSR